MNFFISKDVINCDYVEVRRINRYRTSIIIPDLNHGKYENIQFDVNIKFEEFQKKNDILFKFGEVRKRDNDRHYVITRQEDTHSVGCYALVKSCKEIAPEIYIPADIQNRVRIIKKMQYYEYSSVDNSEKYLTEIYLLKICIPKAERYIPIYYSSEEDCSLCREVRFTNSKNTGIEINEKEDSYTKLEQNNTDKYIPLSFM